MYYTHFGLTSAPFALTSDPHFFYFSPAHRDVLQQLRQNVGKNGGLMLLTAPAGTGKTTLCHSLLQQLPEETDAALVPLTHLSPLSLMTQLFDELHIHHDLAFTLKDFNELFNAYLLNIQAIGRTCLLVLDDAHDCAPEVFEQIKQLASLENNQQHLLQILLVGRPQLLKSLKKEPLKTLCKRLTVQVQLDALSQTETKAYINHRLAMSGATEDLFPARVVRAIFTESNGIPRLINLLCDRALLACYVSNTKPVNLANTHKAISEIRQESGIRYLLPDNIFILLIFILIIGIAVSSYQLYLRHTPTIQAWISHQYNSLTSLTHPPAPAPSVPTVPTPLSPAYATRTPPPEPVAPVSTPPTPPVTPPPVAAAPVAEVTPNVQPTPLLTLANYLNEPQSNYTTETAFTTLFNLWGLDYRTLVGKTACERAATQGLACLYKVGNWADLRRYNHPAVIELVNSSGQQSHVVIVSLEGDEVTLDLNGKRLKFETKMVNEFWLGQLLMFWKPSRLPVPTLKKGMSGNDMIWLRQRLAIINGKKFEENQASFTFDEGLSNQVKAFQRSQKLKDDGIAGEETLLLIDALAGTKPTLKP